uniref:Phosphodiesterase 4D interacting protein n=1 Tax=Esox lucius TaxID=8010 RepID=A0AAY5KU13_ESOLU
MVEKAVRLQLESKELQERLMVSEATVQAQAEQLKDYRDLLTETSVQHDSKQVQVDLQDMGYETCGRSENEAEREETSSPEFDDLEMCTSLECGGSQWWPVAVRPEEPGPPAPTSEAADIASLQQLVEDLRSQLSHSQTVIRSLQGRLRSLSTSSDPFGPSNGLSNPRKVNWSFQFQASPSQSSPEDDEGWESSGGGLGPSLRQPKPDKDLQELESRIGAIEDQLRKDKGTPVGTPVGTPGHQEEGRAVTWPGPGKFDTLIQAQARELSHLRQRMREGLGVCHILTQHLGDTTKAFEELLRANDIDYYMGQSFREQLAQSSSLAQRASIKISGRDHPEIPDDKTGTELLAIRLSKELQQKDKTIEALRAKLNLNQPRFDTPCSSHALSDTTDQSDRISFVSDEHASTNEDLELCSEMDAASEYGQEDRQTSSRASTGFAVPPAKTFGGFPASAHCHPQTSSGYPPQALSYHTSHPSPLKGPNTDHVSLSANPASMTGASLLESGALWDMGYGTRLARIGAADLSSGSSGYQSGTSHTGSDLMKEHLREIRSLRQRLEDSIQTNERLRQQLEEKLAIPAREKCAPTNIYIQGLDSVNQLSSEIRVLKEENLNLQARLQQASREGSKEVAQLREAALLGRARVKEAELETEQWAEQVRRLQTQTQAQTLEISQLRQDKQSHQEAVNRLQHEVKVLQQQLCESRVLVHSLQYELQMYRGDRHVPKTTRADVGSHPAESAPFHPRDLHVQLEQQLTSGTRPPAARKQLFDNAALSPPVRDTGLFSPPSPHSPTLKPQEVDSSPRGQAPDGSFANRNGCHVVGHIDDFRALQQQILEGRIHVGKMETTLQATVNCPLLELSQDKAGNPGSVRSLLTSTKTLWQILEEASSLLRMFWRAALPINEGGSPRSTKKELSLKEEVHTLRRRVSEQEEALRDAMETLKSSNRTKDSMEHFIVSQLSRTKDVLKKARTNLEVKTRDSTVTSSGLLVVVS